MSATLHVFQCRLHEPCARVWICMHTVMVISMEGLFLTGLRIAQRSAAALKTEKLGRQNSTGKVIPQLPFGVISRSALSLQASLC